MSRLTKKDKSNAKNGIPSRYSFNTLILNRNLTRLRDKCKGHYWNNGNSFTAYTREGVHSIFYYYPFFDSMPSFNDETVKQYLAMKQKAKVWAKKGK